MVKASSLRWILTASGLVVMMLILLSDASSSTKGIGVFLAILLISMGVVLTGPLMKYFEETREGTIDKDDFDQNFR